MMSGYAFEQETSRPAQWRHSSSEIWDIVCYTPTGRERFLGVRHIDGSPCTVWSCPDGLIRAQTAVAAPIPIPAG